MFHVEYRDFRTAALLVAAAFLAVLAISGCSSDGTDIAYTVGERNAQAPAVATATRQEWLPAFSVALAWRRPGENGDGEADKILALFMPEAPGVRGVRTISEETSAGTGPVELVRAGDRYFLGWIDNTEPPARFRWQVRSESDWSLKGEGEWVADTPGESVSDFAAAYHSEEQIVLVALLKRNETPPSGFEECPYYQPGQRCFLMGLSISMGDDTDVPVGELISSSLLSDFKANWGVSVTAGSNGFLVTFVERAGTPAVGNRVRGQFFNAKGIPVPGNSFFTVTGESDCADDPQSVIDRPEVDGRPAGDVVNSPYAKEKMDFSETAVAYDADKERYLIGYTTDCNDNKYFRARFAEQIALGWKVEGIDPEAFIGGGGEYKVLAPPISIAEESNPSVSFPMLAYNTALRSYLAGYAIQEPVPSTTRRRDRFYTMHLNDDGDKDWSEPRGIMEASSGRAGAKYPDFISGNIVADPEGRRFYLVWEQNTVVVPCLPRETGWSEPCELDPENSSIDERSKVYFRYLVP